ncbi:eukaryotic translation initiation factor 4 gamma-like [Lathyrus oleraceus]|uniref:eukaryotic translation initiation factor 4 gamma-like n=1 Tax=Pisum sativum TaxID=3888 RepID=UPI0021D18F96|nr:eukaryotic translation initiation factor 4 gamma-like [Pisum sativum]
MPISEAQLFNEPISPPSSPPYYTISFDSNPSDPQSPTLSQLQAHALFAQNPHEPKTNIPSPFEQPPTPPSEPHIEIPIGNLITHQSKPPTETIPTPSSHISPTSEPEPTFPTLDETVALFAESSVDKIRSLSENSRISDDPSVVRIHWNRVIIWMTFEAFKLKGLSEQVRNDFIREAGERLQDRLAREAEERESREAEEKARLKEEEREREAAEKASVEAAAAAEAEAKAKADVEKASHIATKEAAKARDDALTQGEQSHSDLDPLVLNTLEELQKEQQIVRARLDQQDSVNSNIQNILTQLLQRMPPPPNP